MKKAPAALRSNASTSHPAQAQIHLDAHRLGEGAHDLHGPQAAQPRLSALDELGEPEEEVDVAREGGGDAGPEDLDGDVLAAGGDGEMNLGDRRGSDRRVVEGGEQGGERLTELGLDDGACVGSRERRQPILQLRQIGGELLAEQIGARREQLAELDEARTECVQRRGEAQPRASRHARRVARAQQAQHGEQRQQHDDAVEQKERIVARQDKADLDQPGEIAAGAQEGEHFCGRWLFTSPLAGEEGAHRAAMGR